MRDGGAHCPRDCEGIHKNSAGGEQRIAWKGHTSTPQEDPKCLIRPRCHGNGPRCVRIMQRGGDPATAAPAWGSLFRRHESAAVRSCTILLCGPRGPVMGCIACAAKAHPDKAPRGAQYHIQQASRRTVCVGFSRRVGQIGEALETRAVPRCPGVRWRWDVHRKGGCSSGEVLGTGGRGRSVCTYWD